MNSSETNTFVTTRWTQVLAARGDSEAARAALSELCSAYYGPVVAFLTHTGCGADDPRDVAHEFFAVLLERDGVGGVEPARGRFRSYLLGAVKHHVTNRRVRAMREKRGGRTEHEPLQAGTDTTVERQLAADSPKLDTLFDHEWAMAVIERALAALQREAAADGTERQFAVLKSWLSFDGIPGSQAEAAFQLGMSGGAVKVAVHRLRRRFRELVRGEIAQTLPSAEEVEAELRHLIEALTRE
ncbi:MAG TPA: sigma-70 family RNA polymerase sigma factor [Verrucomicrobiota bacterium]|nr:RNA polymerase subunit sigma-24 [Verrucomicrobiales bacterium]HRI14462.1 sigma-70 family RNA polymerase sigma factor [Verrucomicrobiota bacterium]